MESNIEPAAAVLWWPSYVTQPFWGWSIYRVSFPVRRIEAPSRPIHWCSASFCCVCVVRSEHKFFISRKITHIFSLNCTSTCFSLMCKGKEKSSKKSGTSKSSLIPEDLQMSNHKMRLEIFRKKSCKSASQMMWVFRNKEWLENFTSLWFSLANRSLFSFISSHPSILAYFPQGIPIPMSSSSRLKMTTFWTKTKNARGEVCGPYMFG